MVILLSTSPPPYSRSRNSLSLSRTRKTLNLICILIRILHVCVCVCRNVSRKRCAAQRPAQLSFFKSFTFSTSIQISLFLLPVPNPVSRLRRAAGSLRQPASQSINHPTNSSIAVAPSAETAATSERARIKFGSEGMCVVRCAEVVVRLVSSRLGRLVQRVP